MYKICRTEESQSRQLQICNTLLNLMTRCPYGEITISELCRQTQIPRKAFYRYFDTKDDVVDALIDLTQRAYLAQGPAGPESICEVERMFTFWYEHRSIVDTLFQNGMERLWFSRMLETAIEEKVGARYIRYEKNISCYHIMTTFTIVGLLACISYCHHFNWEPDPHEMARVVNDLLINPLYTLPDSLRKPQARTDGH